MNKFGIIFLLFTVSIISSCDTVEEIYLFDKKDPEYAELLVMQAAKCVSDAKIFDALDEAKDFLNSGELYRIYKISQDTQNLREVFVKITNVTATEMELKFNSSDDTLDKVVTFEVADHEALIEELKIVSCTTKYSDHFTASGLSSTDKMTLKWFRETIVVIDDDDDDDEPEKYNRRTDTYTFDKDLPLIFFYYNGTKTSNVMDDDSEDAKEKTSTSKITITDVTGEDECDPSEDSYNLNCEFSLTSPVCSVEIKTGLYSSNRFSDELIDMPDANCNLLQSANL
jgi:hypothetical protein